MAWSPPTRARNGAPIGGTARRLLPFIAIAVSLPAVAAAQQTERLYREACDAGDMIACNVFGLMYELGDGVPRDLGRALALYERACEGGQLEGCTNLGLMYETGLGVSADPVRAAGLYQVACEGGETLGCVRLGGVRQGAGAPGPEGFHMAGRVVDADTGDPLAEAVVAVPELDIQVLSDAAGHVTLEGLPAGRHSLRVERAGYEILEGELEVTGDPDFLVPLSPADPPDPTSPGTVVGRVTEGVSRGLSDVDVTVVGDERRRTLSDRQGRFQLSGIEPGLTQLRFSRLGYAPRTATLVVHPGRTVDVSASMSAEPIELEAIEVTVRSSYLERNGFYRRAAGPGGSQFTRDDLVRIDPMMVSDLLMRVPGVSVRRLSGSAFAISRRNGSLRGPCVLPMYVDGARMYEPDLDMLTPDEIEAVEVYHGLSTPIEYGGLSCGVVLIWTRRGGGD